VQVNALEFSCRTWLQLVTKLFGGSASCPCWGRGRWSAHATVSELSVLWTRVSLNVNATSRSVIACVLYIDIRFMPSVWYCVSILCQVERVSSFALFIWTPCFPWRPNRVVLQLPLARCGIKRHLLRGSVRGMWRTWLRRAPRRSRSLVDVELICPRRVLHCQDHELARAYHPKLPHTIATRTSHIQYNTDRHEQSWPVFVFGTRTGLALVAKTCPHSPQALK